MSIAATRATRSAPSRERRRHSRPPRTTDAPRGVVVVDDDLVVVEASSKPTSASRVPLTSTREACEVSVLTATSMGSSRPASARDRDNGSAVRGFLRREARRRRDPPSESVAGGVFPLRARHPSGFSAPRSPSRRTRRQARASRASPAAEASQARVRARARRRAPSKHASEDTRQRGGRQNFFQRESREGRGASRARTPRGSARHGARVARPRLSPRARGARPRARPARTPRPPRRARRA